MSCKHHLLDSESVEDHADDTAGHFFIDLLDLHIEVFAEEILLGAHVTLLLDDFHREILGRHWRGRHRHGSGLSHGAAELGE